MKVVTEQSLMAPLCTQGGQRGAESVSFVKAWTGVAHENNVSFACLLGRFATREGGARGVFSSAVSSAFGIPWAIDARLCGVFCILSYRGEGVEVLLHGLEREYIIVTM
jgi:hypothetical protein